VSVRRVVPDIHTRHLQQSREFYTNLLGLEVAMDLGWITTLVSPKNATAQLSLLERDDTAPVVPGISIEVEDVDTVHAEARRRGEKIVHPLTNEPWGVRRFFVEDPEGTVVNVMQHLRPDKA
jgi:catechol 2,3-dioxygenase-like lactoylglutathione lyase family enzyme